MTPKQATIDGLAAGMTCPEASAAYGIPVNRLYGAAYNLGKTWPSAIAKRHAAKNPGPYSARYDITTKRHLVIREGRPVACCRTTQKARLMAAALNRGDVTFP